MAIYSVTGKPGSGKSFWAVHHLVTKYFNWNEIHREFLPKFGAALVTNLDKLRLDHYELDEMIDKAGGVNKFFTVDYQREVLKRFIRIVYIIDEAGKYFPPGFKDEKVLFFFQYHRHLGIDVYLISVGLQDVLANGLVRLIEKECSRGQGLRGLDLSSNILRLWRVIRRGLRF